MENRILDIHCPNCGAPANFDIMRQQYVCSYCKSQVGISAAQQEKQGFRKIRARKLQEDAGRFRLQEASCTGCGARVVFEENEALSNCAFCGRSLVRADYLHTPDMPEYVVPFRLTEAEARERLEAWCRSNGRKPEAKKLRSRLADLKGFYLPYELIRGPVHMKVSRMDGGRMYPCEGFMNDEFVNRSRQLDNLLLDAMEPFDLDELKEFDFAYVAGQRVKTPDLEAAALEGRAAEEAGETYLPAVRRTLQTKAVEVRANVSGAVRLPVLLPVYYISDGELMAAVNGQTGKVSVRAEKVSHYYFLPWWLKALLATVLVGGALFGAACFFGMAWRESLVLTGLFTIVFVIIMLCMYSDTVRNSFAVESGHEIYTSDDTGFRRENGRLVPEESTLRQRIAEPVFLQTINGRQESVVLRFASPPRVLKITLLCVVGLFLPVICALFLTGFDFSRINLGGSAVWFCIAVPIVPVWLIKFGILELYEKPWVYIKKENGRLKRVREKRGGFDKELFRIILRAIFVPPASLAVWFGILSFFVMVYLTAGGE